MEWQGFFKPHSYESFFNFSPPQKEEPTEWSFEENKQFENALTEFDPSSLTFFEDVASRVPGKSIVEIINHYQALVEDLDKIESGLIEPPQYKDDQCDLKATENVKVSSSKQQKGTSASQPKRRGVPWTEEEHRLFLKGLETYGKGDWRSISRYCVVSKSPTQIASHAQKYFRRLQTSNTAERRRPSIHDIHSSTSTTTNLEQTDEQLPPPPNSFPRNSITNANNSQQQSHGFINFHSSAFAPPLTTTTTILVPPQQLPLPPQSAAFSYNNLMINANNNSLPPPMTPTTTTFSEAEPTPAEQSSTEYPSSSLLALPRNWFWR